MSHALRSRTPSALFLVLVALTSIFAGCVDQEGPDCVDGVCREVANPGDAFETNATVPMAEWDGCVGTFGNIQLPAAEMDGHLPDAFHPVGSVPGLADLRIVAMDCPRAEIGDYVIEPFRYATVGAFALPTNTSWNPEFVPSTFIFELLVSDADAALRLAHWGLPAMAADIEVAVTETAVARAYDWHIATDDRSYAFGFPIVEGGTGGSNGATSYWAGDDEFRRVDANHTREFARNLDSPMPVSMTGEASLGRIVGSNTALLIINPYQLSRDHWQAHPIPFFV